MQYIWFSYCTQFIGRFFDVTKFVCYGDEVKPDRTKEKFFFLIFYEVTVHQLHKVDFHAGVSMYCFTTYVH